MAPRNLLAAAAIAALASGAAAAPAKQLICGATLNGVGGDLGKVLEKKSGVVKGPDCAQACADREGCTSYQYCGYGSYDDTCLFVTAPEGTGAGVVQASKGDCFLGSGHWRQVPTDKPYGGWTVGIACSSVAADPVPVPEGEDGAPADGPADAPGPEPEAPVVAAAAKPAPKEKKAAPAPAPAPAKKAAAAPAKKSAPAPAGPPASPGKAGWAAALPADAPVKPVTVPTAVTRGAPAPAAAPVDAAQPDLKASSIKA